VDHFDVVAGTGLADPVATWLTLGLGGGLLEDFLDVWPSGVGTTWHEGWTVSGTLLTTRDTGTDKEQALGLELVGSSDRVRVVRVTTVNDDVALLEVGLELADEVVHGLTGLDEEDDSPWGLELGAQLLDGVGADNVGACSWSAIESRVWRRLRLTLGLVLKEVVDFRGGSGEYQRLKKSRSSASTHRL
jgi:hypothetical protein